MASVIKVLLALRHQKIPPHLHAATLNPRLDWSSLPLHVPRQAIAWPASSEPRMAGVSAFGISGTNVHMVISEPPPLVEADRVSSRARAVLTASAKSREALVALAGRYSDTLAQRPAVDLASFACAANLKRAHFAHRLALIAQTTGEAQRELRRFSQGDAGSRVRATYVAGHRPPRIGMLFADARSATTELARLYRTEPGFRAAYDGWVTINPGLPDPEGEATMTVVAAIGFQFALSELWRSWGIRPAMVAGEGVGEIAAALVAGGLPLATAAALARSLDLATEPSLLETEQLPFP